MNKTKTVLLLAKWLIENEHYDKEHMQKVAPKVICEGMTEMEHMKRIVIGLKLNGLIKMLGCEGWDNKTNEQSIPIEMFKWSR